MAARSARFRAALVTVATVVSTLTVLGQSPARADVTSVSGSAVVATVRSTAGILLAPTPDDVSGSAAEPGDGYGPVERAGPSLSLPDVLSAAAHRAGTAGAGLAGENHLASAQSSTSADTLRLGVSALTAANVASSCRSDGDGSVAETVLTDARAGGNPLPVRPVANTQIVVPGVLTATLNEQAVQNRRGVATSVTVIALHVQLLPTATSPSFKDIVIGESTCRAAGPDVLVPTTSTSTTTTTIAPPISVGGLVAAHSGKALDVTGISTADGAPIQQWAPHGGNNQLWRLMPAADGAFTIASVHSGKVLDVEGASRNDGARVIQWAAHGGPNQLWRMVPVAGGEFTIVAVHSGKVLDVTGISVADGAPVQQWASHGGGNQRWRLVA